MKESDLYIPVRDWLVSKGYTIHVEVFGVDIVATKPDASCHRGMRIAVVELKLGLTDGLFRQLLDRQHWADEVWGAIASQPRQYAALGCAGFGLLRVQDGKVEQILKAKHTLHCRHKQRDYRLKKMSREGPAQAHELAGLPACAALREQRNLRTSEVA